MSHFYITLPSNSSMEYHPENTVSQFTTVLAQPLELAGDWEVALSEISIPTDWCNLSGENHYFMLNAFRLELPDDWYPSNVSILSRMVSAINQHHPAEQDIATFLIRKNVHDNVQYDEDKITIIYDQLTNIVRFSLPQDVNINMSIELANVLGFDDGNLPLNKRLHVAERPARLKYVSKTVFVYCDLIEPVFVGDTKVQLLRTVNMDSTNKHIVNHIFTNPIYVPLQKKHFNSIEINIMTNTGDPVPFTSGHSVITLHFRRTSNPYFLSR
jgi:hypothetical protein